MPTTLTPGTDGAAASSRPGGNEAGSVDAEGPGVRIGWMDLKRASKAGQMQSLTLVGESTREGRLIASGRAQMPGGKVVSDSTAREMAVAFDQYGFGRFAVGVHPESGPSGALGVVWMDTGDGRGIRSLFLLPGSLNDSRTRDLPKTYEQLKALVLSVHQMTPGSMVVTGEGWSGDDMMNQRPGGR